MPERDYKKEYRDYHSKERQKKNRAKRNKASRNSNCKPGQEVDHKVPLIRGGSNAPSNWRVVSMETNRSKGSKTAQATDRLRSAIKYSSIKTAGLSGDTSYNLGSLGSTVGGGIGGYLLGDKLLGSSDSGKYLGSAAGAGLGWGLHRLLANKASPAAKAPVAEAAAGAGVTPEQLRVAILSGSTGEDSKSRALAEAYRKQLESQGAAVDWLDMREMGDLPDVITGDHSKINPYLDRFANSDAYVVASPVYNWGPSGKVNQFLDLAMDSDTMTGKPYSLLSGAGSPRSALAMGGLSNRLNMELKGVGIGAGVQVAGKEYNKLTGNIDSSVVERANENADRLLQVAEALRQNKTAALENIMTQLKR